MDTEGEARKKLAQSLIDYSRMDLTSIPTPTLGLVGSSKKLESGKSPRKKILKDKDGKPRVKRQYKKRNSECDFVDGERPPPKKRGRKSNKEKELAAMDFNKNEFEKDGMKVRLSKKELLEKGLKPKKSGILKPKKIKQPQGTALGPTMFDKKLLAGPHLTMKQVLEYILTDHSYCVPPDPLPAVGGSHQMIRYIMGPKNGAKAVQHPIGDPDRSPSYHVLPRSSRPHGLATPPQASSKLENLLKRDLSPMSTSSRHSSGGRSISEYRDESDVEIDVESVDPPELEKRIPYDVDKAKEVMNECAKYVEFARGEDTGEDWESKVLRTGWTKPQSTLYDKVVGALHAERLSRLAYKEIGDEEPVLRRASMDKTACRVRRIFGEYLWDMKLTQWLNSVLTESLNFDYLAIYLDVLQTLKSQCPQLVSRIVKLNVILPLQNAYGREQELSNLLTPYLDESKEDPMKKRAEESVKEQFSFSEIQNENSEPHQQDSSGKAKPPEKQEILLPEQTIVPQMQDAMMQLQSAKNAEALKSLLGRQWDPFAPDLLHRLKKLSSNPVFILLAPGAINPKFALNRRLKHFERMFRRVGHLYRVRPVTSDSLKCKSVSSYIESLLLLAKEKMREARIVHPDRPIYLVGWGSGAILAARLSAMVGPVDGVIALGFPLHNLKEMQDDMYKIYGGLKHPVLFVIGGAASNNCLTDMELFRKRLACETSLVVIGSGNENLYVSRDHREKLLVTQSYVDKNIMDEIAFFVNLHSKHNQIIAPTANISIKHFPKQSSSDMGARRPVNMLRANKRKSSDGTGNPPLHDVYPTSRVGSYEPYSKLPGLPMKNFDSLTRPYEYDFEMPKFIPSMSSNKRKVNYKPEGLVPPIMTSSTVNATSGLTASQLLQQSPIAKRRISKPSGPAPAPRVPLLGQHSSQRPGLPGTAADIVKKEEGTSLMEQPGTSVSSLAGSVFGNKDFVPEKKKKKKSKDEVAQSPTASIVSALTDLNTPMSGLSSKSVPTSSLDIHNFVLQHQQKMRQLEQTPQTSQLYKLLSPGSDKDSTSSMTGSSVKLLGSQQIASESDADKTALITKQNLISNMTVPVIRLARPLSEDPNQLQKPIFVTSASTATTAGQQFVSTLSTGMGDKIFLQGNNKSIKLNANDLKNLINSGGKGIQVITGISGSGPVSILVKRPEMSKPWVPSSGSTVTATVTTTDSLQMGVPSPLVQQGLQSSMITLPLQAAPAQIQAPISTPMSSIDSVISSVVATASAEVEEQQNEKIKNEALAIPTESEEEPVSASELEMMPSFSEAEVAEADARNAEEPMDIDDSDDMCGITISNTFSVCPNSGERMNPVPVMGEGITAILNQDALAYYPPATATISEVSVPLNIPVGDTFEDEEGIVVPIHQVSHFGNYESYTAPVIDVSMEREPLALSNENLSEMQTEEFSAEQVEQESTEGEAVPPPPEPEQVQTEKEEQGIVEADESTQASKSDQSSSAGDPASGNVSEDSSSTSSTPAKKKRGPKKSKTATTTTTRRSTRLKSGN